MFDNILSALTGIYLMYAHALSWPLKVSGGDDEIPLISPNYRRCTIIIEQA